MGEYDDSLPGRLASKLCENVEVKNEERGEVRAVIATMGVMDKDGDMIMPGAFGKQDVLVSAYNHTTWRGALPVGRGKVYERGNEALADLRFFMDDDEARRHFRLIKNVGAAQEFSFGFDITEEAAPNEDQRQKGVQRVIKKFKVYEVSPVFRGAGVNTRVVAAKTEKELELELLGLAQDSIDHLLAAEAALEDAERRAARKARPHTPAAALRAADGNRGRIHHVTKSFPPFGGVPHGHVVVTGEGRVFERNIRNITAEWTEKT